MTFAQRLSLAFGAGVVGALANVIFLALAGSAGLVAELGIDSPKPPMPVFLYKQMVWGGLWGFIFLLPIPDWSWWLRGLLFGLLASLSTMVIFMPMIHLPAGAGFADPGYFGLGWGALTPVLVLCANSAWGLAAAGWYQRVT